MIPSPSVGMLDEIKDIDDNAGAFDVSFNVGFLLLPNYFTNQRPESLCNAT